MVPVNKGIANCPKTNKMRRYGYMYQKQIMLRRKLRLMFRKFNITNLDKIQDQYSYNRLIHRKEGLQQLAEAREAKQRRR